MFLITEARTSNEYWNEAPDVVIVEITDSLVVRINEAIAWLKEGYSRFGSSLCSVDFFWYGCDWLNTLGEASEILNEQDLDEGVMIDTAPPDDMYEGERIDIGYLVFSLRADGTDPEVEFKAIPKHMDDIVYTSCIPIDRIMNPESVIKVDWVAEHANYASDDGGQEGDEDSDA